MDEETLFLKTLDDLERLSEEGDDYSMLRASALLRQLLLDDYPLIHQVNRKHKLKITFSVSGRRYTQVMLSMEPTFFVALDGLCPPTSPAPAEELSLEDFLKMPGLKYGENIATVSDLITHAANVSGAVHKGRPRNIPQAALSEADQYISAWGLPISAAQLKPIISVALDGLAELREVVEKSTGQ